ncbi:Vacuolar sorting 38 and autophagy-related subunit 14 [Rhizoctonia solani]|uniref:Autophagy-related protein 14 n=1 Tax=Rhizoctonia solani TaxID=456999 RepID=A0A8H8NUI1_9AGAM|nr:Vacuolar sorting 38 and autophagy-related subunit 14 [Rhizoctonia solani]QRW18997.1 Vacuolar sorting 38 and autophagy-related subunit 14 [Rhizoctonia solani]
MSSRLVETFVTLSVPELVNERTPNRNGGTLNSPTSPTSPERSPTRGQLPKNPIVEQDYQPKHSPQLSTSSLDLHGETSGVKVTLKRAGSTRKSNGPTANGSARTPSISSPKSINFPRTPSPPSTRSASPARSVAEDRQATIPFFISSIHRPSTNPSWTDLDANGDFADWVDRQQNRVTVALWGRVDECSASAWSNLKGKDKDIGSDETNNANWKVLVEWDVQMDRLEKVETTVLDHLDILPSNTLLFSLAPSGDLYFLPPNSPSRPSSPAAYASDSELATTTLKTKPPTRSEILQHSRRETRMKQSATWADVVKLANLYAVVRDTQTSLDEVLRNTNDLIEQVGPNVLTREIGEREEHLRTLRQEVATAKRGCAASSKEIQSRIEQLRARREALRAATDIYDQDVQANDEKSDEVNSASATYLAIHNALAPRRTTLCHTLDFIFPIEPDAERAADLVFTILDVPLPVPVAPSDPAPPLNNEEAVSAALGYAAHVVALLRTPCCGPQAHPAEPQNLMLILTHNSQSSPPDTVEVPILPPAPSVEDTAETPRALSPTPTETPQNPAPSRSSFLSPLTAILRRSSRPKVIVDTIEPAESSEARTPTAPKTPETARPENSPSALSGSSNSSTGEVESNGVEAKGDSPSHGLEKLVDKTPVGEPPASPLSHTIT